MNTRAYAKSYTNTGTEAAVLAASPHKLISMQLAEARKQIQVAIVRIGDKDIQGKGKAIGKAIDLIANLDASLDYKAGGELAANLHQLYDYAMVQLTNANVANDVKKLAEIDKHLSVIESAWTQAGMGAGA